MRATGGGAFKFADLFRERLGVVLKKEDEIACLVQVRCLNYSSLYFNQITCALKFSDRIRPRTEVKRHHYCTSDPH